MYVEMVNDISADIRAVEAKMGELRTAHEARMRCVTVLSNTAGYNRGG